MNIRITMPALALMAVLAACSNGPQNAAETASQPPAQSVPTFAPLPNVNPAKVPGGDVQRAIDDRISTQMRAYDSNLKIDPSSCAPHLDLSNKKTATCVLPVDGNPVTIHVSYVGPPAQYDVNFGKALFYEMSQVQRFVALYMLRNYHAAVKADCGAPSIRLVPIGATFDCALSGFASASAVVLRTTPHGNLDIELK
jgi:hypothetical protein